MGTEGEALVSRMGFKWKRGGTRDQSDGVWVWVLRIFALLLPWKRKGKKCTGGF